MKKINNNLPRGGAEWGRALRRFLSDNIVPIMFVLICAYCIPRADLSWNYLLNEGMTRLGRNAFLKIGRASVGKECSERCRSRWSPYH